MDDEFEMEAGFVAARDISQGEELDAGDMSEVTSLHPRVPDDDAGWIAYARFPDGRAVFAFDFRRNLGRATVLLARFDEFAAAAELASSQQLRGPAIDLMHAASELLIECLMGRFDQIKKAGRGSHSYRTKWVSREADMGNVPVEFRRLIGRLGTIRGSARYAEPSEQYEHADLDALLSDLRAFERYTRVQVSPQPRL